MKSIDRPYFRYSTDQLRELFQVRQEDVELLSTLAAELQHRDRPAAIALLSSINRRLHELSGSASQPTEYSSSNNAEPQVQRCLRSKESFEFQASKAHGGPVGPEDSRLALCSTGLTDIPGASQLSKIQPDKEQDVSPKRTGQLAATPRDLLRRLLEYIGEQLKEVDPRGYHISRYGFFRQAPDINGLPGVESDIQLEGDHIWLRVARLEATAPPKVPENYRDVFRVSSDPFGPAPSLDEAGIARQLSAGADGKLGTEENQLELEIRNSASAALASYSRLWSTWAEGEKPRRRTIALYGDLFARKQQMDAEQTAKPTELVWGVGIAVWRMSYEGAPFDFKYPVLTQAVEITLDEKTMSLDVRPRATEPRVEMDAYVACGLKGSADVEVTARAHLNGTRDRGITPFDAGSYTDILKLVAANLDSSGAYQEVLCSGSAVPDPGPHLVVTDAWVLFVRPRTNNYLVEDLKRLQNKLATGCDIPDGSLALVSPPSEEPVEFEPIKFRGLSGQGGDLTGTGAQELYFPQPYNDEQVTIIQRLERAAGVTVQGPPGTGKTHTIANIICHYLATGRRVLVTSKGEPALEVLQSKIPEEVRPLTVALLTNDREGMRQFQASIEAIQHRVSQLNPQQTQIAIDEIRKAIDMAHSEIADIDRRVDEIALTQLADIEVDGRRMRAQKLADLVVSGQAQHDWFDDRLSLGDEHEPPLTEEEGAVLREARRKLGPDLVYVSATRPSADTLPGASDIAELHDVLCRMQELDDQEQSGTLLPLKAATKDVLQNARMLLEQVEQAKELVAQLECVDGNWPFELRSKCPLRAYATECEALTALFPDVDRIVASRAAFLKTPVEFPEAGLESTRTREAVARAAQTGRPFGLLALGATEAKANLASVKVAGLPPKAPEDWAHVQDYLLLHEQLASFGTRWNELSNVLGLPQLKGSISSIRDLELTASVARSAWHLATEFDATSPSQAEAVFDQVPTAKLLGKTEDLQYVRDQLLRHLTRVELSQATTNLAVLQEKLVGCTGPVSESLRQFIREELGNRTFDSAYVAKRYTELTSELRRIAGLATELCTVRDSSKLLERAGATRLADRIRSRAIAATGEDTTFPVTWREAWTWSRIKSHLDSIEARDQLLEMAARRRELELGLARLYKDMVAKAAWLSTKRKASPKVLQALAGYATAIRRIGQGTGPNAVRYRRDARECMLDAAGAVPCWIMSHSKVSESMPPDFGVFDLVVVDEASQSDLWALPAIVRGKKILVVGDDKQVSPDGGFIKGQRIEELKQRFLSNQPYGIEMTPEKSLYDLAARVFAAEQVMLREHFRCVPAIISYSNGTFYKGAIQPLRIPKSSERIDPPLVDVFVEGGLRDRHDCNDQEADAIASEIVAILKEPRFSNRSIGVVSLLGMEQAKNIDARVRQICPAAELLHRKFECGDARTFQGSERDIMFLSMVVDRNSCKALSGNMFEQRFNVAASRARDRMYLVRSVTASDLSEKDLRLTLLNHFHKPLQTGSTDEDTLIALCESGFEKELFSKLVGDGYRVIPQVKSGAYRIDMVVEGVGDVRLAIECDGDEYHGPDRWQQDMHRQRVLERAGWTFWRCFASTWSLRKEEVFCELKERLAAMGIEPVGALERVPTLVEQRSWRRPEPSITCDRLESAIQSSIVESPIGLVVSPDGSASTCQDES